MVCWTDMDWYTAEVSKHGKGHEEELSGTWVYFILPHYEHKLTCYSLHKIYTSFHGPKSDSGIIQSHGKQSCHLQDPQLP